MLNKDDDNDNKDDNITQQNQLNHNYNDNFVSHLYTIRYLSNKDNIYVSLCSYLDIRSLCRLSVCNKLFNFISSSEDIWKPLCIKQWPELKMATSIAKDPFPAYKSCYKRKFTQENTSMQDLMKIFGMCDWYSCPNGHLYAIGECRMAVMMSICPECGEKIGGRYHRVLNTNHHIGAVNGSYNPIRYNNQNEDEILFKDVANVIHKSKGTGFQSKDLGTINEYQATDFDQLFKQFADLDDAPDYILCPLSMDVYIDPVVTPKGQIYERKYIVEWLQDHDTDPIDAYIQLSVDDLESEDDVKKAADLWRKTKKKKNIDLDDNANDDDNDMDIPMQSFNVAYPNQNDQNDNNDDWDDDWNDDNADSDDDPINTDIVMQSFLKNTKATKID